MVATGWRALGWFLLALAAPATAWGGHERTIRPEAIVAAADAPFAERLAAQEVRRYVYLRTGKLLPITDKLGAEPAIVVGSKGQAVVKALPESGLNGPIQGLAVESYLTATTDSGPEVVLVVGGSPMATLYAAYRLAEHLGVRFAMHGDTVPDARVELAIRPTDERGKPLFDRRGIQPFHDFPEGPDWWNLDDYKAVIGQLPKLRMNFFGLHCYPEGGVGPEPLVWIGTPEDANGDGSVDFSYPARHFITMNPTGAWGYRPMKTSEFRFGAAAMFERDDYGANYMEDTYPWTKLSTEHANELFGDMGGLLNEAFTWAGRLGVKTCIGTETPLTIPAPVKARLKAQGKDPADPAVVQEVYEGMFRRIMAVHPLDYYWFWTPEGWTWSGTTQEQIDATVADLKAAMAAADKVKAPFTLATCGWVLGPPQDRALFDKILPKEMPLSCINRQVGKDPVEPGFKDVAGRPKWAIPWMEDDPALNSPQLWAGRMRKDAADALAYGCTGLMGIHWRTRELGPNVAALAYAAWEQQAWNPAMGAPAPAAAARLPEGPDGGRYARFGAPVAETEEDALYQSVRYDVYGYYFDVPDGAYRVTLKFNEPHYTEPGKRVFGVKVQGKAVIESLDLFAKVGRNQALDYTFEEVKVADGRLAIELVPIVEFPCIAAIAVEGPAVRKVNCGGEAWGDYRADWAENEHQGRGRYLPVDDFYADWAAAEFGPGAAEPLARLFARIDGRLPRPSEWINGPGGTKPDARPWDEVAKQYAFVDEMASLRERVIGAGNLERFDYWLSQFQYMRANAQVNCTWARYNAAMAKVTAAQEPAERQRLSRETALPLREELVEQVAEAQRHLLSSVTTAAGMGNVANWQQHVLPMLLGDPGAELEKALGEPLPATAQPPSAYAGPARLFVPTVRTSLVVGEALALKVIMLGRAPGDAGSLYWRPFGQGAFARVALEHVSGGVYRATLPAEAVKGDFEYYVEARSGASTLRFPATAPELNQTVVVVAE